jgi:hypothetical protein
MSTRSKQIIFIITISITIATAIPISSRDTTPNGQSCDLSIWETVILFYILNYGTHAFTIKSVPGESTLDRVVSTAAALLLPFSGVYRACNSIARGKIRGESDLQHALRLGALCQLGGPQNGAVDIKTIHGQISLPKNYSFEILKDTSHINFGPLRGGSVKLSSTRNPLKVISAIVQLLFACLTLYHSRGDQLDKYGYAAYGLTVIPYAVMSFVNLVANLTTPDYPAFYMVRTETMDRAERDGGIFVGAVANLYRNTATGIIEPDGVEGVSLDAIDPEIGSSAHVNHGRSIGTGRYVGRWKKPLSETALLYGAIGLGALAFVAPYVIIDSLTGFKSQSSTSAQRAWTMAWLVVGEVYGLFFQLGRKGNEERLRRGGDLNRILFKVLIAVYGAPAIGGLVVTTQMIVADGYCGSTG